MKAIPPPTSLSRREAIRRILAAGAMLGAFDGIVIAAGENRIGFDPDLLEHDIPWPLLLTPEERRTAAALADLLLPADAYGPAASEVGVVDFLDEWISAPYPAQQKERDVLRPGLSWIDQAGDRPFHELNAQEQTALLVAITQPGTPEHQAGHRFFRLFRDRAAAGYFTTREGWAAIGYTGNIPIGGDYPPPPDEALKHAGLL